MEERGLPPPHVHLKEASADGSLFHIDYALRRGADINSVEKVRSKPRSRP
jgi:hypothetical protein